MRTENLYVSNLGQMVGFSLALIWLQTSVVNPKLVIKSNQINTNIKNLTLQGEINTLKTLTNFYGKVGPLVDILTEIWPESTRRSRNRAPRPDHKLCFCLIRSRAVNITLSLRSFYHLEKGYLHHHFISQAPFLILTFFYTVIVHSINYEQAELITLTVSPPLLGEET